MKKNPLIGSIEILKGDVEMEITNQIENKPGGWDIQFNDGGRSATTTIREAVKFPVISRGLACNLAARRELPGWGRNI